MIYVFSWFAVASLLALWSLGAWAVHAVAHWSVSNAGALSGAGSGAYRFALPEGLAPWVPTEVVQGLSQMVAELWPLVDSLLQASPQLAGGLTVVAWSVWAVGGLLLLALGAVLHLLISLWRRRSSGGAAVA